MDRPEAGAKRNRILQIAALALVWGIGMLAVMIERSADKPARAVVAAGGAAGVASSK